MRILCILLCVLALISCSHSQLTPYEASTPQQREKFKKVLMPFAKGTHFKISQGAYGSRTHNDPGHEYTWDFDVPYGTQVLAVEAGKVIQVWEPGLGGGCDSKFNGSPHNIQIEHADGTVAQYTHVQSRVKLGDLVKVGQPIAVTAMNGYICTPQLDFTVFQDRDHTFLKGSPRNVPVLFYGLPDGGMAHEGFEGKVATRP